MNNIISNYYDTYKESYNSKAQLIRVITENWCKDNMYCPFCLNPKISQYKNNYPVVDFYCNDCGEEFQLKSKKKKIGNIVVDGEYNKMIDAIYSNKVPNFIFLSYSEAYDIINDLMIVPKEFILPPLIKKRKALSPNARRAGWTGCNILIKDIPDNGKLYAIKNEYLYDPQTVKEEIDKINFFRNNRDVASRGWISDILLILSNIEDKVFTLKGLYKYADILKKIHPNNNNIEAKIRQQVQILRDQGMIEFLGKGVYKKIY